MLSKLRRLFTYKNIIIGVLLVFALPGVAVAGTQAKKILITSTKQISPSVLKKLKGANGTNGTNGINGTNGTPGINGAPGKQGEPGKNGENGKQGEPGAPGKEGPPGKTGFTKTLPKGDTETGTWALGTMPEGFADIAISFPIPLEAKAAPNAEPALSESQVHFILPAEAAPPGCGHGTNVIPEAEPGNLCIYTAVVVGAEPPFAFIDPGSSKPGAGASGMVLGFAVAAGARGWGDWAVTAPE